MNDFELQKDPLSLNEGWYNLYAHVHIFNEILRAKFYRPIIIMKLSMANRTTPPKIRLFLARRFYIKLYATVHISHIFGNVSNFIFEFMNSECSKLFLD